MQYVISLGLTVVLELLLALCWGIRGRDLLLVVLVNALTNPLVVLWHNLSGWTALPELCAVITEALLYRAKGDRIRWPFWFSAAANVFSYSTGVLLAYLL